MSALSGLISRPLSNTVQQLDPLHWLSGRYESFGPPPGGWMQYRQMGVKFYRQLFSTFKKKNQKISKLARLSNYVHLSGIFWPHQCCKLWNSSVELKPPWQIFKIKLGDERLTYYDVWTVINAALSMFSSSTMMMIAGFTVQNTFSHVTQTGPWFRLDWDWISLPGILIDWFTKIIK